MLLKCCRHQPLNSLCKAFRIGWMEVVEGNTGNGIYVHYLPCFGLVGNIIRMVN